MQKYTSVFINLFPLWAISFAIFGYTNPSLLSSFGFLIIPVLIVIMLSMGMTLTFSDFRKILSSPKTIFIGVALQYILMPAIAFILSNLFNLSIELTAGMVLVGSTAGGTASNVITYLAKGNVALSITMTMLSTILSVFLTPLLCVLYLNQSIAVPASEMFFSILQIVILPVVVGTIANNYFGNKINKIKQIFPLLSVISIVFIIGVIIAINKDKLTDVGFTIFLAVILHNLLGMISGYYFSKLMKYDEPTCRTISIEVGMQNSGLSVALGLKFFSAAAAIPGALFSIWHNISGSILASFWAKKSSTKD